MGEDVRSMLGAIHADPVYDLLRALAAGDGEALLQRVAQMTELAVDFTTALQDLLGLLHQLALLQTVPGVKPDDAYDETRLIELAGQLEPEDVQLFYQIGLTGQSELHLAPDPRSGFEMLLLRMLAFRPGGSSDQAPVSNRTVSKPIRKTGASKPMPPQQQKDKPTPVVSKTADAAGHDPSRWESFAAALKLGGIASQLANNCVFHSWDGETLHLKLDPAKQQLRVGQAEKRLQDGIRRLLGDQVKLQITAEGSAQETPAKRQARKQAERQQQAEQSFASDPLVRELQEHFDARLVPDSIKPLD
jgi:DNA polymerase-3 subunit gamma/tau